MRFTYWSSIRLNYLLNSLIRYLLKENSQRVTSLSDINFDDRFNMYKSLCNVRPPYPISEDFLDHEKRFFNEFNRMRRPIQSIDTMKPLSSQYPAIKTKYKNILTLWQGDITTLEIDAIVNAANSEGLGCFQPSHRCIDNLIHTYAGVPLRLECHEKMKKIHSLKTGKAFLTKAYNLPSKYVIHTVGPIIESYDNHHRQHFLFDGSEEFGVSDSKKQDLANCYLNSLKLAQEHHLKTIAFPCISTGLFRFPQALASKIAIETVIQYLDTHEKDTENGQPLFDRIIFNVYGDKDYAIYDHYIKNNL